METSKRGEEGDRLASPRTRYEWRVTTVRDGQQSADALGICRYQAAAVRHVEKELANVPGDADAYGTVRGLTVTFTNLNAANGVYQRWEWQAVATRDVDGGVTWFRDTNANGDDRGAAG